MGDFLEGAYPLETLAPELSRLPDAKLDRVLDDLLGAIREGREPRCARARDLLIRLPEARVPQLLGERLRRGDDPAARNAARTALAILAGRRFPPALDLLENLLLRDEDSDVRVLAATTLGEAGDPRAVTTLVEALGDPHPNVVAAAAEALALLGDDRATEPLIRTLEEGHPWSRLAAAEALGGIGLPRAIEPLADAAADPEIALAAIPALGRIAHPRAIDELRRIASNGTLQQKRQAWRAIARLLAVLGPEGVTEALRRAALEDESEVVRAVTDAPEDAALLLGLSGTTRTLDMLLRLCEEETLSDVAAAAIRILPDRTIHDLVDRLHQATPAERAVILDALDAVPEEAPTAPLVSCLADPDPEIRAQAADLLASLPPGRVDAELLPRLEDPSFRLGVVLAFSRRRAPPQDVLVGLLDDEDDEVRRTAARGLSACTARDAMTLLRSRLDREPNPSVARELLLALASCGQEEAIPILGEYLSGAADATRFFAIEALGRSHHPDAVPLLLGSLDDPAPAIRAAALRALGEIGDPDASERVAEQLGATSPDVRRVAGESLVHLAPDRVRERVRAASGDADREVRLMVVRLLAGFGDDDSVEALQRLSHEDPDALVRRQARQALPRPPAG